MRNINGEELREILYNNSDATVVDVRTAQEIKEGMIEGALHIDVMSPEFADEIKKLDREKPYLMVCRSGNRSGSACGFMESQGFKEIYNLNGGMMFWDGATV